jgi:hypothetical protein
LSTSAFAAVPSVTADVQSVPEYITADSSSIQPRADLCEKCTTGQYRQVDSYYTTWVTYDYQDNCEHGSLVLKDELQERYYITTYKCDYCGNGFSSAIRHTRVHHPGSAD